MLGRFVVGPDPAASGAQLFHMPQAAGNSSLFSPLNGVELWFDVPIGGI